jgi:hypothetical protein
LEVGGAPHVDSIGHGFLQGQLAFPQIDDEGGEGLVQMEGGTKISDHLAKDNTELPEPPASRTKPRGGAAAKSSSKAASKTSTKRSGGRGRGGRG